jgi:hypothetical protein
MTPLNAEEEAAVAGQLRGLSAIAESDEEVGRDQYTRRDEGEDQDEQEGDEMDQDETHPQDQPEENIVTYTAPSMYYQILSWLCTDSLRKRLKLLSGNLL